MPHDALPDLHPINRYRKRHGLTLKVFAERAGTVHSTVIAIEAGRVAQPNFDLVRRLIAATDGEVNEVDFLLWHYRNAIRCNAAA